jgi:hypothetical protein
MAIAIVITLRGRHLAPQHGWSAAIPIISPFARRKNQRLKFASVQ